MDIAQAITNLATLSDPERIQVFEGMDAYTALVVKRIAAESSPLRQIINGDVVRYFHKSTDYAVNQYISQRVEKGIAIKNLILQSDKDLVIELSDPKTLKETRLLPESFRTSTMLSIYGDCFSVCNLNKDDIFGFIVNDSLITETLRSMFDVVWEVSEPA